MEYPKVHLKPGKGEAIKRYHPWVFSGAVAEVENEPPEGSLVRVIDSAGQDRGLGHIEYGSIRVRLLHFGPVEIGPDFWRNKLQAALTLRQTLGLHSDPQTNMYRLVHGEGDGLPGLIIDRYGSLAVLQCHTVGMYLVREEIAGLLVELMDGKIEAVYDKSAKTLPFKAKVEPEDGYITGSGTEWPCKEFGLSYLINPGEGQKTGFFVDQRLHRRMIETYAAGRRVLNLYAYSGGFSLSALRAGAQEVISVDSARHAIESAEANVKQNFPDAAHTAVVADVPKYLQQMDTRADLIVLDPPAFAKHRKVRPRALKGYRRINQAAFERLAPGGILFTFSCSQAITRQDFREAVFTAAAYARRKVRILHQLSQPPDHPVGLFHPEGEYLKGLVLYVE